MDVGEDEKFERLVREIEPGGSLLRRWELQGGVSARVTALEIERPGGLTRRAIVRRYGAVDLEQNPRVAAHEFRLLQIVRSAGLPAPAPYYLDESGEIFPTPYIVVEYVEGETEFAPTDLGDFLVQLATYLSGIHNVARSNPDLSFLPRQDEKWAAKLRKRPARLDESIDEGRIRDALEPVWPPARRNEPALLHGDFWPGNVLWKDGRIAAVIDWEDAALGDPLADLANSRLEILWAFGVDAMHSFTDRYRATAGIDFTNLPCWDLCAALRPAFKIADWAGGEAAERRMRDAHRLFVTQALEELAAR